MSMLKGKRVLLVIAGGIAAFKALELVRLIRAMGADVRCVLTSSGSNFVTPLSLQALTGDKVYTELFSLTDESEMGHIQLSRDADVLVVAPATANLLARMRAGIADDLASTVLLATDKPVLVAPSMNVRMWEHPATIENMGDLLLVRSDCNQHLRQSIMEAFFTLWMNLNHRLLMNFDKNSFMNILFYPPSTLSRLVDTIQKQYFHPTHKIDAS